VEQRRRVFVLTTTEIYLYQWRFEADLCFVLEESEKESVVANGRI
jgi:hypothetical protein